MSSSSPPAPRESVRFDISRCLGAGGFGEVYLARMTTSGGLSREVAVKLLLADIEAGAVRRLRDEARLLAALHHRAILQVYDLVELDGRPALVTEYVDGADLSTLLAESGALPPRVALELVAEVAGALRAAWTTPTGTGAPLGLVHRDIKPGNIRVAREGTVKLLDFGIAVASGMDREAKTGTGLIVGTLGYLAPERLTEPEIEPPSDVYALGCVLYEALLGERLFAGASQSKQLKLAVDPTLYRTFLAERLAAARVTPGLGDLLRRMLAYDAGARPDADALEHACEELAASEVGPTLKRWARERPWGASPEVAGPLAGRTIEVSRSRPVDGAPDDRTVGTPAPPTAPRPAVGPAGAGAGSGAPDAADHAAGGGPGAPRAAGPGASGGRAGGAGVPARRSGLGVGVAIVVGVAVLGVLGVGVLAAVGAGAWALRSGEAPALDGGEPAPMPVALDDGAAPEDGAEGATGPVARLPGGGAAGGAPASTGGAPASTGGAQASTGGAFVPGGASASTGGAFAPGGAPAANGGAATPSATDAPLVPAAPAEEVATGASGSPVTLAGGLTVRAPAGWQAQVADATRAALVAPDGQNMVIVALDDAGGVDLRAELSTVMDLGDGVVLQPSGSPRSEAGGYTNEFSVRGAPAARAVVTAKLLDDGRAFAVIGISAGGGYEELRAAQRAVYASGRFGKSAAASAAAGSWAAYLKGRYLVRLYTGNGYQEKEEIWLCSNGNYAYAMDGGGFTAGVASGAFASGAEGAWSATGSTSGAGTVTLTATDGSRAQRTVRLGSDGVYVDGVRWMRGDNTRCP